jgi:hypothetical protein
MPSKSGSALKEAQTRRYLHMIKMVALYKKKDTLAREEFVRYYEDMNNAIKAYSIHIHIFSGVVK